MESKVSDMPKPMVADGEDKKGIKELREMQAGVMEMAMILMEVGMDGFQLRDFAEFWQKVMQDEMVKAKMQAAYEGMSEIPAEMKDLSLEEGLQLAMDFFPYVPRMISILSKKK